MVNKLDKNKYKVLNDIMIRDEYGTHQIDHIVITSSCIFVIEMKNYYGFITGKEYDDKWCQHFGRRKYYFINPIHQNYGHIKSLSNVLNLDSSKFISIICFSNQAKISIKSSTKVTQIEFINSVIKEYDINNRNLFIDDIYNKIISLNIVDKKFRKEHVNKIREKKNKIESNINNMLCPKCGSALVERDGKYGKFIGCSNYPHCRFIKKQNLLQFFD